MGPSYIDRTNHRHGQTLTERRDLIESRADALLDQALRAGQNWATALGTPPKNVKVAALWRQHARTVAAYRDRYMAAIRTFTGTPDKLRVDTPICKLAAEAA